MCKFFTTSLRRWSLIPFSLMWAGRSDRLFMDRTWWKWWDDSWSLDHWKEKFPLSLSLKEALFYSLRMPTLGTQPPCCKEAQAARRRWHEVTWPVSSAQLSLALTAGLNHQTVVNWASSSPSLWVFQPRSQMWSRDKPSSLCPVWISLPQKLEDKKWSLVL